jgi:hypothetical protein
MIGTLALGIMGETLGVVSENKTKESFLNVYLSLSLLKYLT